MPSWRWLFVGQRYQWAIVILFSTGIVVLGEFIREIERNPDSLHVTVRAK
jgi:hypothetical protein